MLAVLLEYIPMFETIGTTGSHCTNGIRIPKMKLEGRGALVLYLLHCFGTIGTPRELFYA